MAINLNEIAKKYGGSSSGGEMDAFQAQPSASTGFGRRLALSFGGREADEERQRIEEKAGVSGKFDVGDIADVAGASLPIIGGMLGSAGGLLGSAAGAGAGQGVRRLIGGALGVDKPSAGNIAKDVALTTGGALAGGYVLGKAFNVVAKIIPSKFVSTIFKQSADDIKINIKTGGADPLQSEEVLREGFRGGSEKMMTQAWNTMKQLEAQAQKTVAGKAVVVNNKSGYINLIKDYVGNLKKVSYGFEPEIAKEGRLLVSNLSKTKGNTIPGEIALQTRRFIDSVRRTSSFRLDPNLSPKEAAFKKAADVMRKNLSSQIDGLAPIMSRYRVHINAFEDLATYAAKTQNKDLFDLLDVFIMYGIDPAAYLVRRGLTSAAFKTNVAQGLYQGGKVAEKFLPKGLVPSLVGTGTRKLGNFLSRED